MAKKSQNLQPLTFEEIVLRGDADIIRQALEARSKIDEILVEREAAYQRIAELEAQVETIVGEEGLFPFPEPPAEVALFAPAKKKPAKKAVKKAESDASENDTEQSTKEDEPKKA